jgi:predicted nucleic-acid-binding Zn-ribbon protein
MMNQPAQRPQPSPCPHCQGRRVWAEPDVSEGQFFMVYGHEKSNALFTRAKLAQMAAAICLNCGYTAFYAKDVLKMRADFQNHPEWFDL